MGLLVCGFVIYGLYYVEVVSLCGHFLESFCHKSVLNFVKSFFQYLLIAYCNDQWPSQ